MWITLFTHGLFQLYCMNHKHLVNNGKSVSLHVYKSNHCIVWGKQSTCCRKCVSLFDRFKDVLGNYENERTMTIVCVIGF